MQVVTNYAGKQRGNNFPVVMWVIFKFTVWRWIQCSWYGDGSPPAEKFIRLHMDTALFGFGENHLGAHQNESCTVPTKMFAWSVGQYRVSLSRELSLNESVLFCLFNLKGSSLIAKAPTKSVLEALVLQPWMQVVWRNRDVHTIRYS